LRRLRTMTRDAMVALDLPRDPTLRVSLPEPPVEYSGPNSLTPEQLAAFLEAMRTHYPQHYALVVTLAFTGLRFCHAGALRREDWDEPAGVLRVVRKHFRGGIGPVSRKKQAPREYPVEPDLARVLREHRSCLLKTQAKGLAECWIFPSTKGNATYAQLAGSGVGELPQARRDHETVHGPRTALHVHRPGTSGQTCSSECGRSAPSDHRRRRPSPRAPRG
jgi:integrase